MKDVLRLAKTAPTSERVMVSVVVLPGSPVGDGLGHVFRSGEHLLLPKRLARHMIKIRRVRLTKTAAEAK